VFLDFTKDYVIDILPSRAKHYISSYLRSIPISERAIVNYVSIDMNDNYRDICSLYFPNAIICVDSFHVVKYISTALDNVKLRILRKYAYNPKSNQYYLLKYQKHLLFTDSKYDNFSNVKYNHHFKYKVSDKRKLEMLLAIDPDLYQAFLLKERYLLFNNSNVSLDIILPKLLVLIADFANSSIPEMVSISRTLNNWKSEIVNSFTTIKKKTRSNNSSVFVSARVSNGPIEGRNKYLKLLLKLANGFHNFDRFRNRALFVLNRYQSFSSSRLDNSIVRHFPSHKKTDDS